MSFDNSINRAGVQPLAGVPERRHPVNGRFIKKNTKPVKRAGSKKRAGPRFAMQAARQLLREE